MIQEIEKKNCINDTDKLVTLYNHYAYSLSNDDVINILHCYWSILCILHEMDVEQTRKEMPSTTTQPPQRCCCVGVTCWEKRQAREAR